MIITNDHRGRITNALLARAFAEQLADFLQRESDLATDVYAAAYPPDERAALTLLDTRHENSMERTRFVTANVGGQKIHIGITALYDA